MDGDVVRRRINMLAAHFATNDEIAATHVLPMNCSGTLNSVLRRCDNKMYFARQASDSLGFFMKPTSVQEFQDSSSSSIAPKSCGDGNARAAYYARPAIMEPNLSDVSAVQPVAQHCTLVAPEAPTFARPSRQIGLRADHLHSHKKITNSEVVASSSAAAGIIEWFPRIDVAESEGKYVMTVEVAGVRISDIRVEVDDEKLSVRGRRSTNCWRVEGCNSAYHKREILYGPYEVLWPLPVDVNKDSISAEFWMDFCRLQFLNFEHQRAEIDHTCISLEIMDLCFANRLFLLWVSIYEYHLFQKLSTSVC